MFKDEMSRIEICGKTYPYRCDLVVLEKIQEEFGDILQFELNIRGVIPYYDEDTGVRDKKRDKSTVPGIKQVCRTLAWMIQEGIEVSGEELAPPTEKDIMRQRELTIYQLSAMCFQEYAKCFLSTQGKSKGSKKVSSQNSTEQTE